VLRVSEATGMEAGTIHRLLEIDPKAGGFRRGPGNPLDCDLLIIDETSMVPTDERATQGGANTCRSFGCWRH
jgi:ATP-dependent exoDNAse (exonuclease V) alpha subunit